MPGTIYSWSPLGDHSAVLELVIGFGRRCGLLPGFSQAQARFADWLPLSGEGRVQRVTAQVTSVFRG